EVLSAFVSSHDEVRALLHQSTNLDLNRVRFKNPFVSPLRFTVGTGLQVILAHDRRHLWQGKLVRQMLPQSGEVSCLRSIMPTAGMEETTMFELRLAGRMSRLGTETAFEVLNRARALEKQGKEIIHLEIGEPDFDTPSNVVEAGVDALRKGWTHY